jgi:hypothetical protein
MTTENTFKATSWDEKSTPEENAKGPHIARAHTTNEYAGRIEGTGVNDYAMYYSGSGEGWGAGTYHGYELVTGTVDGRKGSFVLRHEGSFEDTTVRGTFTVVEGSGTEELEGLKGTGGFVSKHGEEPTGYTFELS